VESSGLGQITLLPEDVGSDDEATKISKPPEVPTSKENKNMESTDELKNQPPAMTRSKEASRVVSKTKMKKLSKWELKKEVVMVGREHTSLTSIGTKT